MTVMGYVIGYLLSFVLTVTGYSLVVYKSASPWLITTLIILAIIQLIVQLVFFLHLGDEVRPRYKLASFLLMGGVLVIVVVGSIWIMDNLDYNMMHMTSDEKTNYMKTQHDKGF